jgi:signal transduction histidine kinase
VIREAPLRFAIRLAWLVVLVGAVLANAENRAAAIPLVASAAAAWLRWTTARESRYSPAAILVMASAGALLSLWTPVALGFVAMAGIAAGSTFELGRAALVALAGPAVLVVAFAAAGWSTGVVAGGAAGALAGLVGGVARRQAHEAAEQRARTHLAREVHDVLAHTLAALAIQLEAAEAVLDAGDEARLREVLQRSRRLVADGIEETAEAVRALRDEPVEIAERLRDLVTDGSTLRIEGTPRPLPARAGLALYRAAQEALTNAHKHAPGAPTEVVLSFSRTETVLRVENGVSTQPPERAPGSRLGLQGMRERLELAGGTLSADASRHGFVVRATVPA